MDRPPGAGHRGFCGIGVVHGKSSVNIGTLWRSAHGFGADFIFTVGRRYSYQPSDVTKAPRSVPLFNFQDADDLVAHLPLECFLVGVELSVLALPLPEFAHPERACYLLGAEDHGLPMGIMRRCHTVVFIPGASACLNVSSAGTVVLYDRWAKGARRHA